jgi:ACS family tartrate transporter-like MFS transporter
MPLYWSGLKSLNQINKAERKSREFIVNYNSPPKMLSAELSPHDEALVKKVSKRIIPFLILLYFFAYLDRVNISFAALQMNGDLGFSTTVYGFGASMFFIAYFLFEVPSNLALSKVGARLWIARIMITWGLISTGMVFVSGEKSFYALRFLLGVAEAGFFPGIMVYMSGWFPRRYRARTAGVFMVAIPLSGLIGSPISGLILDNMNGVAGLPGWQWMFVVEGVPAIFLGIACLWLLTERPADASWLTRPERDRLEGILAEERRNLEAVQKYKLADAFTNPGVLLLAGILFCIVFGVTGIAFFLPLIIKSFGFSNTAVGFLSAVPFLCGAIAMVFWSRRSDAKGERLGHLAFPMIAGAIGFVVTAATLNFHAVALLGLVLAAIGVYCANSVLWTLPTSLLTGIAAAAAVALINSFANLSGIVAPPLLGWSRDHTGGFAATGLIFTGVLLFGAVLVWIFSRSKLALGVRN